MKALARTHDRFALINQPAAKKTVTRRVGAETSATRHILLDAVERLMLEDGYAAVTYRNLAAKAGVTPAVVQYYFPTLDSLFLGTIRRRTERHVEKLLESFAERPNEPLRVIWEYSKEESVSGLMVEFTALANHRKSIQAEIATVADRIRKVQIDAINATPALLAHATVGELSKPALVFFVAGIPRLISMDANLGSTLEHPEIIKSFERWLDAVEPRAKKAPASTKSDLA